MNQVVIRRPTSLQEVAVESATYSDFGHNLKDFLHEFALAKSRRLPLGSLLEAEPPFLAPRFDEGKICDAFIAGTADYLARTNKIQTPAWALTQARVLDVPWFSEPLPTRAIPAAARHAVCLQREKHIRIRVRSESGVT